MIGGRTLEEPGEELNDIKGGQFANVDMLVGERAFHQFLEILDGRFTANHFFAHTPPYQPNPGSASMARCGAALPSRRALAARPSNAARASNVPVCAPNFADCTIMLLWFVRSASEERRAESARRWEKRSAPSAVAQSGRSR